MMIDEFLDKNFLKPYPNKRVWASFDDEEDMGFMWDLNKVHAGKDLAHFRIYYFGQDLPDVPEQQINKKQGNLKIELYLISWYSWDTFFEGYIDNFNELLFILNSIGIPFEI